MSRPGEGTGQSRLLQVVTLGSLFMLLAKAPHDLDYGPMHWASPAHRLEGPKMKFQFYV
jgi:hypothetical protein